MSQRRLGCNAQLIVDEFGEKLLEELDYVQEGRNLSEFYANFYGDAVVKIPKFYPEASVSVYFYFRISVFLFPLYGQLE